MDDNSRNKDIFAFNSKTVWIARLDRVITITSQLIDHMAGPVRKPLTQIADAATQPIVELRKIVTQPLQQHLSQISAFVQMAQPLGHVIGDTLSKHANAIAQLLQTTAQSDNQLNAETEKQLRKHLKAVVAEYDYIKFEIAQLDALLAMLKNLRGYSDVIVRQYITGILDAGIKDKAYLLDQLLDCISIDLGLLQNAVIQRYHPNRTRLNSTQILLFADVLARELISPIHKAIDYLSIATEATHTDPADSYDPSIHIEFVTYFTDALRIRSLPYYPGTVLLGLPYATTGIGLDLQGNGNPSDDDPDELEASVPWNFLILAHEVAHYLYWHGKPAGSNTTLGKVLEEKVKSEFDVDAADWQLQWLEELFCDVYSVMVLGPVAVLGMQSVFAAADPEELFTSFGEHPPTALRPLLALETLNLAYPKTYYVASPTLFQTWNDLLYTLMSLDGPHVIASSKKIEPQALSVAEAIVGAKEVISLIISTLQENLSLPLNSHFDQLPWSIDLEKGEDLNAYGPILKEITHWPSDKMLPLSPHENIVRDFANDLKKLQTLPPPELITHLENALEAWGDKGNTGDGKTRT